jgi:hypothetical protein
MISPRTIVESGLSKTDAYQKRRSILLSNYIALILCAAIVLLGTTRFLLFQNVDRTLFINYILGAILFLLAIVFNRFHLTTLSRLYLSLLPTVFVWYVFITTILVMPKIETSVYDSLRIFLLALSCIPYLILDKKQLPVFVLGILPSLISIVFFENLLGVLGIDHNSRGIAETEYQYIQMRTIISYLIINSCCIVFQIIIQKNDEFNQRLLAELKDQSDEIAAQNEELMQSEENLSRVNLHLESLVEERAGKIREQNEMLLKYAYANAHHVRGPVARVLGLIQVSKMKTDLDFPWFFEKVEDEAKAIDAILKRIAVDFETDRSGTLK